MTDMTSGRNVFYCTKESVLRNQAPPLILFHLLLTLAHYFYYLTSDFVYIRLELKLFLSVIIGIFLNIKALRVHNIRRMYC
jgi:hypothetical protein